MTVLNTGLPSGLDCGLPWLRMQQGDACDPPPNLVDERFDLVFSNSCIEHVGGHERRQAFARTVGLATRAWVQTPYRYFPIEPHWMLPLGQQIPVALRAEVVRRWPLRPPGFPAPLRREALGEVMSIELLGEAELRWYFPSAEVLHERFAGVTKSLIALIDRR